MFYHSDCVRTFLPMANVTLYFFNKIKEENPHLPLKEAQLRAVAQWQSLTELERMDVEDLALGKVSSKKPSTDKASEKCDSKADIPHFPPEFDYGTLLKSRQGIFQKRRMSKQKFPKSQAADDKIRVGVLRNIASLYGEISEDEMRAMKIPKAMAEAVNERNRIRRQKILESCPSDEE